MPEVAAGTVLAFDFGLKRVGVAVGEPEVGTAHALPGIEASGAPLFEAVGKLVAEWRPAKFVVGLPLRAEGGAHEMTRRAERFARQLEGRFSLPVALVDERYTSVEAESRMRAARGGRQAVKAARARTLDSHAAQLILEQYFGEQPA